MALSGSFNTSVASGNSGYPNYATFSWTATQSIANNSSTISWKLTTYGGSNSNRFTNVGDREVVVSGTKTSTTNVFKAYNGSVVLSGTRTINHNSDGTATFSVSAGLAFKNYGRYNSTGSSTFTLNTIPRASTITTFNNFTIGDNIPWGVDRKHSSYTHWLRLLFGGKIIADFPNITVASGRIDINEARKSQMLNIIPNSLTGIATLQVWTYNGSNQTTANQVGSVQSKQVTATVGSDVVPEFDTITHSENITSVHDLVGAYVQSKSRLNLAIIGAQGTYGSTIRNYKITAANTNISAQNGVSGYVSGSGDVEITGTVTDSRGRSFSKKITVPVLPYKPPKIEKATFIRCKSDGIVDPLGDHVKVTIKSSVASLMNETERNKLTYTIKSKQSNAYEFEDKITVTLDEVSTERTEILGIYEFDYSFNMIVETSDIFEKTSVVGIVPIGEVLQHWAKDSTAFGMLLPDDKYNIYAGRKGIKSEGPIVDKNKNELAGFPIGFVYISIIDENPSKYFGGTWERFAKGRTLVGVDESQSEFNTVEKTGGHKALQEHVHTFSGTTGGGGAHNHQSRGFYQQRDGNAISGQRNMANEYVSGDPIDTNSLIAAPNHTHSFSGTTAKAGTGNSGNLQPFITVYYWLRTA